MKKIAIFFFHAQEIGKVVHGAAPKAIQESSREELVAEIFLVSPTAMPSLPILRMVDHPGHDCLHVMGIPLFHHGTPALD